MILYVGSYMPRAAWPRDERFWLYFSDFHENGNQLKIFKFLLMCLSQKRLVGMTCHHLHRHKSTL